MERPRSVTTRPSGGAKRQSGGAKARKAATPASSREDASALWAALDDAAEAIGCADAAGQLTAVNQVFVELFGHGEGDLLGRSWRDLIHPDDRTLFRGDTTVVGGVARGAVSPREARGLRQDGSEVPLQIAVVPAGSAPAPGGRRGHYLFIRDLTDRKKMEDLLSVAGRMASVGTLAAGVAHEINNPLAYIVANIDFARRQFASASARIVEMAGIEGEISLGLHEVNEALAEARQGAERVRSIVRDLKIFARADTASGGPVSLRRVLESSINMAWNEIRHRARLVKDFGEAPLVEGNESRLGQVFLNLLLNAAQAIGEGEAEKNEIRVSTRTDDFGHAIVEIRDTGHGIPADIQQRIFDPFFTTKPPGIGTGLGLWICHGILAGMSGQIAVASEPGRGAVFRVTLPSVQLDTLGLGAEPLPAEVPTQGARILIIDDEPMIVSALKRSLGADYQVTGLVDGREALALLEIGQRFDVILCDLMMPDLNGMDLYDELSRVAPEQKDRMIFVTGGAFTPRSRAFLDRVTNPRVEKPIDFQNLRSLIKNATR